jgi:hypothetical protein
VLAFDVPGVTVSNVMISMGSDSMVQLNRTVGRQILSYGWEGQKPATRVTKQAEPDLILLTVEADPLPVGA